MTKELIGSKQKSKALALINFGGVLIYIRLFRILLTNPPYDAMLNILSIVTPAVDAHTPGGLDYRYFRTEKTMRKKFSGYCIYSGSYCLFFKPVWGKSTSGKS